jgi:hypothetical protein
MHLSDRGLDNYKNTGSFEDLLLQEGITDDLIPDDGNKDYLAFRAIMTNLFPEINDNNNKEFYNNFLKENNITDLAVEGERVREEKWIKKGYEYLTNKKKYKKSIEVFGRKILALFFADNFADNCNNYNKIESNLESNIIEIRDLASEVNKFHQKDKNFENYAAELSESYFKNSWANHKFSILSEDINKPIHKVMKNIILVGTDRNFDDNKIDFAMATNVPDNIDIDEDRAAFIQDVQIKHKKIAIKKKRFYLPIQFTVIGEKSVNSGNLINKSYDIWLRGGAMLRLNASDVMNYYNSQFKEVFDFEYDNYPKKALEEIFKQIKILNEFIKIAEQYAGGKFDKIVIQDEDIPKLKVAKKNLEDFAKYSGWSENFPSF